MNPTTAAATITAIVAIASPHAAGGYPNQFGGFDFTGRQDGVGIVRVAENDTNVDVFVFAPGRNGHVGMLLSQASFQNMPAAVVAAAVTAFLV